MSGKRVLSGGAVGEAEVRRYAREFAPSETVHPSLALNECAQLNAIGGRVFCFVTEASNLEWQLESSRALLRSWKISLTGVTLHISPGNRNGTPVQPFAWPARKSFHKSDIAKRVTFRLKSATPTGREMGAANLEDGISIAALLCGHGKRAMVTRLFRHGDAPLALYGRSSLNSAGSSASGTPVSIHRQ